jgi:hypothetical protein
LKSYVTLTTLQTTKIIKNIEIIEISSIIFAASLVKELGYFNRLLFASQEPLHLHPQEEKKRVVNISYDTTSILAQTSQPKHFRGNIGFEIP